MAEEQNGGRGPSRGHTPGESQHLQPPIGADESRPTLPPVSAIPFPTTFPNPLGQNRSQSARGLPQTLDPRVGSGYGSTLPPAPTLNPPNGYTPAAMQPLPSPFAHADPRYVDYYGNPRPPHHAGGSTYPPPPPDPYHSGGYPGAYRIPPGPPGPPGPPPYTGYTGDYQQNAANPHPPPQAAPRQRTSIACRYCRKRKIRCSGYQNTSNGKCMNCDKLRIDCVFQPVSSNSSAAFVPVSAVPGGVPPGTPLYGAYGQPLAPATGPVTAHGQVHPHHQEYGMPYGHAHFLYPNPPPLASPSHASPSQASPPQASPPQASPASQYPQQPGGITDQGRRRPREPEDEELARRLPPPNGYSTFDPSSQRRVSPASNPGSSTPPRFNGHQRGLEYDPLARTPTPQRTPRRNGDSHSPPPHSNIMSVDQLLGESSSPQDPGQASSANNDIDQHMLGRLNRRRSS